MILKSKVLAALVVAILFGGILFSSAMGWWQTESTKEAATFSSGEFAGLADPADIRGSYTFGDVETNFGIPAVLLAEAFAVETSDASAYQVKSLEELYAAQENEIGTASVRLFVAFYNGLPFDLSTDIWLPESAAGLLADRNLTPEQVEYLNSHTVTIGEILPTATASAPETLPATPEPVTTAVPSPETTEHSTSDRQIKGKTTFAELLDWGLSKEAIEQILGVPLPAALGQTVKDFCTANGLTFETVKAELQTAVDQLD